jgi:large subunit ribosomal protein L30
MKKLKVMQTFGLSQVPWDQRLSVKALGLKGIRTTVLLDNTPSVRGQIKKVMHLVSVEEVEEGNV